MSKQDDLTRREFLQLGLGALGLGLMSSIPTKGQNISISPSSTWNSKDFSAIQSTPPAGLSQKQINQHLGLYTKYIKALNKVNREQQSQGLNRANITKKGFVYGGVVLHELYFSNMNSSSQYNHLSSTSWLKQAINQQFGSVDNMLDQFFSAAKICKGWVILGVNLLTQSLEIMGMDAHNEGSCLSFLHPILVIDVYEHAYMIDFGTNKSQYLDIFANIINWPILEQRYRFAYKLLELNQFNTL